MTKRIAAAGFFVLAAIAAVAPIRSYDYFWHLTTGRWIVEHYSIPRFDPLTLASGHVPWINGEWLYQIVLYALHGIGGDAGISIISALLAAAIFAIAILITSQDAGVALLIAGVAFAGASDRLGVRPAAAAALLIVIAIGLLASRLRLVPLTIAYAVLTIVWINVHPSALLAPVLALICVLQTRSAGAPSALRSLIAAAASAIALLINPYGWNAILAPLRLTSEIHSGAFVNAEWLPSTFAFFPLLYITIGAVVLIFLGADKRANAWRFVIFVLLAALAIRYVRNQGLYFAALPLLVPPVGNFSRRVSNVIAACALIPLAWAFQHDVHRPGIDVERFPTRAVAALRSYNLAGNIYNVDQFGGLLEWTFYPERRALTDGRNELFRDFIEADAVAHRDSRAWHAMIAKYGLVLAVDEYQRDKIEVLDVASGERQALPASLVRYRRRDWALIAFDDAAMVFARRDAFPAARLDAIEYRFLVPDDPGIRYRTAEFRNAARKEVARAKAQFGDIRVVRELEAGAAGN
ncbi:MAG TPA: hypothetical protein VGQ46_19720 [Thermoanaerobaculia bacterium]|jgi:hypothetical protein|nr:hypothetical protein [Thermoanaerobaculia bacterium]